MSTPDPVTAVPRKRRRVAAIAAGSLGIVAVVGGGAWAWQQWMGQGPQAAEVLPGDTLAYVGLDLDPPGGQKLAAYDTLRRFPSLEKQLGIGSQDDLRRAVIDKVSDDSGCDIGLDDIEPWAGDRAALAVVPQGKPEAVVVVQASDTGKAERGLDDIIAKCDGDLGYATGDGWVVLARNEKVAQRVVADGRKRSLSDDTDFQELTGAAGDPGVITLYAAPEAGKAALKAIGDDPFLLFFLPSMFSWTDPLGGFTGFLATVPSSLAEGEPSGEMEAMPQQTPEEKALFARMEKYDQLTPAEQAQLDKDWEAYFNKQTDGGPALDDDSFDLEVPKELRRRLEAFSGIGGVARFDDGNLELEVIGDPMLASPTDRYDGDDALDVLADLPDDVAAAFGGRFAEGWAERSLGEGFFGGETSPKEMAKSLEKATGLTLADLETLGGDRFAIVAGPGLADTFTGHGDQVPVAIRIAGDADAIEKALDKLRAALGTKDAAHVISRKVDGGIVIGADQDFVDEVAEPAKRLGDSDRFRGAVPDAKGATTITYVDFDAGDWLKRITAGDLKASDVAPLATAGLAMTREGDRERMVLRVAFDR
ncbi:hypothetical protein GCM10022237_42750 [Nocardioides ginsengisoli]|uniref:DUF3352 domain-containing protein n=1 Tax=Nocardioides ginsengisoli TaxID=363868 RepID=A0ABW3VUC4_9ACTN